MKNHSTIHMLRDALLSYETGYAIELTHLSICFTKHEEQKIYIGTQQLWSLISNEEKWISKKVTGIVCEIVLYTQHRDLFNLMHTQKASEEETFLIEHILLSYHFHTGVDEQYREKHISSFINCFFNRQYNDLKHQKKLAKQCDISTLTSHVTAIVNQSNLSPTIQFNYELISDYSDLGGYVLGSYGSGKIKIFLANLVHAYQDRDHPYSSMTEFIESVTIHELGHMYDEGNLCDTKVDQYRCEISNAITCKNKQQFNQAFFYYHLYFLRMERRAWKKGEQFYLSVIDKQQKDAIRKHHLSNYYSVLRTRKEKWLEQFKNDISVA